MKKFAFLGAGRMATALMTALLDQGFRAECIWATDREMVGSLPVLAARGVRTGLHNGEAVAWADVVFLCVKPQQMALLLADIGPKLAGKIVVSIAAGIPLSTLARFADKPKALIRVMPNTPMQQGAGVAGLAAPEGTDPADLALVKNVLALCGQAFVVPEVQLDAVTALSGSGPAYFYEIVRLLAEKAEAAGIDGEVALAMAIGTMAGATAMLAQTKSLPRQLIDQVVSPGGTTAAALAAMEKAGLAKALSDGFDAAERRSAELAKELAI